MDMGHKANPDEKGTERAHEDPEELPAISHKANPDEKGTESAVGWGNLHSPC